MKTFPLEIVTPRHKAYDAQVQAVYAPTANGTIGVLADHMPLFTALTEGEVKVETGTKDMYFAIGGGFMEVVGNKVSVLVSRAVDADEINEAEIIKAQKAAKEAIARKAEGEEMTRAQAILRRSIIELSVLRRRRKRKIRI